jgi:hypothetical protein
MLEHGVDGLLLYNIAQQYIWRCTNVVGRLPADVAMDCRKTTPASSVSRNQRRLTI